MSDYPLARLLADFCNTLDERVRPDQADPIDHLATGSQLREWLVSHDLLSAEAEVGEADLRLAHDLRAGIRYSIAPFDPVVAGKGRDLLRAVGQYCSVTITFDAVGQAKVAPADNGAKGGLAQLLLTILEAQKDESWQRLKMCGAADCRWVFVDHSRPGTGRWCAMKDCGNRAKKRAYRERQKQGI